MENTTDIWTKKHLNVYILLYAAKVDLEITEDEKDKIVTKYGQLEYDNMFKQIRLDNDFESIEKIKKNIENLNLSREDITESLNDTKNIFEADGKFDAIEKGVFSVLKKIMNK